nr:hypothetical protein [Tanacetum cinerariifolium]
TNPEIAGGADGTGGADEDGGAGAAEAGGVIALEVRGCSYKTFLNCKPHSFNRTEEVVRMSRWFKKMESVFEISKCVEEDKNDLKGMMTVEYYPRTKIQKMEQELWTLSMKGDDIDGYTNCFHKLAAMCSTLVTFEFKMTEHYVWELLKKIQGNVTSSRSVNIHEVVTMARELVDHSVRAKATRINDRNKRK